MGIPTLQWMLLAAALPASAACSASYVLSDDAGPGRIDGAAVRRDAGPPHEADLGGSTVRDAGGTTRLDGGHWVPPPYDGGPEGDRAGDVWEGYIESYAFGSGSDRVRIEFDSATGDGPRTGIVVFGDGTPVPPATDPNVGYPLGLEAGGGMVSLPSLWEGFEYPIVSATVSGARVTVTIEKGALWGRWCALQMPVPTGGGNYGCLPNSGYEVGELGCFLGGGTTRTPVDCGKLALCGMNMVCQCDATRCQAGSIGLVAFDFHVAGTNGDGSVMLDSLHNMHLTRP